TQIRAEQHHNLHHCPPILHCCPGRPSGLTRRRQNCWCGNPPTIATFFATLPLHHGEPDARQSGGEPMSGPGRTRGGSTRYTQMSKEERRASLRLLGTLLKPYTWQRVGLSAFVVLAQLASVAGPAIIAWGIDNGIPALLEGNATPAVAASVAHIAAALIGGGLMYVFTRWNMTIGQNMLFGLRKRLFLHSQ